MPVHRDSDWEIAPSHPNTIAHAFSPCQLQTSVNTFRSWRRFKTAPKCSQTGSEMSQFVATASSRSFKYLADRQVVLQSLLVNGWLQRKSIRVEDENVLHNHFVSAPF